MVQQRSKHIASVTANPNRVLFPYRSHRSYRRPRLWYRFHCGNRLWSELFGGRQLLEFLFQRFLLGSRVSHNTICTRKCSRWVWPGSKIVPKVSCDPVTADSLSSHPQKSGDKGHESCPQYWCFRNSLGLNKPEPMCLGRGWAGYEATWGHSSQASQVACIANGCG